MTQNWDSSTPGDTNDPPAGYPAYAPGYPPAPGPIQPGPPGYPPAPGYQYPPGYQGAPGYQHPGYQGVPGYPGYPGYPGPQVSRAPGSVRAASVLAYVQAGLIIFAGLATISGSDFYSDMGLSRFSLGPTANVLTLMGVAAVVAGGLLIAGGVQIPKKKVPLILIGSALSLCVSVWWLVAFDFDTDVLIWAMLLSAMPIISVSLTLGSTTKQWIANQQ